MMINRYLAGLLFSFIPLSASATISETEARFFADTFYSSAWAGNSAEFYGLMSDDVRVTMLPSSSREPLSFMGKDALMAGLNALFFERVEPNSTVLVGEPSFIMMPQSDHMRVFSMREFHQSGVTRNDATIFTLRETDKGIQITDIASSLTLKP